MLLPLQHELSYQQQLEELLVTKLLTEKAQLQYQQGNIADEFLLPYAEFIKKLSDQYVTHEYDLKLVTEQAIAYALYYTPINFVKILRAFQLCSFESRNSLKLLDFGAGPGTASIAGKMLFEADLDITVIEKSQAMKNVAKLLLPDNSIILENLNTVSEKQDFIICGNSLNEMSIDEIHQILPIFESLLTDQGYLIIIEPALQSVTQKIMALRNWIIENSKLNVFYPCTHSETCPMLISDQSGWCHTELTWDKPLLVRQFDKLTGFNKHRLKTSVFIFSKQSNNLIGYRVVNFPKKSKTGVPLTLCGENCFKTVNVAKKHGRKVSNYSLVQDVGVK